MTKKTRSKTPRAKAKNMAMVVRRGEALPEQQGQSAEALISQAINKGVSVETMERLLAMRRELKQEYAKAEFDKWLAAFQAECPIIKKTKGVLNKDKKSERYKYAPLDSIINQVKPLLLKHGFSYTIDTKVDDNKVTAICKITHRAGHSQTSEFTIPIDPDAYMNNQQKFASALTFAKRYAFCNAFGILTGDDDDDGRSAGATAAPVRASQPANNVDYLGQIKTLLFREGGKTEAKAIEIYNDYTGEQIKSLKVDQNTAKKMVYSFLNSPMIQSRKK